MERDTINLIAGGLAAGPVWVLGTLALLKVRFHAGVHAAPWRRPTPPVRARGIAAAAPPPDRVAPPALPRPDDPPPWLNADTAVRLPAVRPTSNGAVR